VWALGVLVILAPFGMLPWFFDRMILWWVVATGSLLVGRSLVSLGKRMRTRSASAMLAQDHRPPILYLRSFANDGVSREYFGIRERSRVAQSAFRNLVIFDLIRLAAGLDDMTIEQDFSRSLGKHGPFVAIGRPGEQLATAGAARVYVDDAHWKQTVLMLIRKSQIILWQTGDTEGTQWELAQLVREAAPARVLLFIPNPAKRAERYEKLRERSAGILPVPLPATSERANLVMFDAAWNPRLLRIEEKPFLLHPFLVSILDLESSLDPFLNQLATVAAGSQMGPLSQQELKEITEVNVVSGLPQVLETVVSGLPQALETKGAIAARRARGVLAALRSHSKTAIVVLSLLAAILLGLVFQSPGWRARLLFEHDRDRQFELARYYYGDGEAHTRDAAEAVFWFRKAAQQGHPVAQYYLGKIYERYYKGVETDYAESLNWYLKAGEQEYAPAELALGQKFSGRNYGFERNPSKAIYWFHRAAEHGNPEAETEVCKSDLGENGAPVSYPDALKWCSLAAEQWEPAGQAILGTMYEKGLGVARDLVQAYVWFYVASMRGTSEEAVEGRDRLAEKLSPSQLAKGKRLAQSWMAAHQK
jgi:TPR repeat protein